MSSSTPHIDSPEEKWWINPIGVISGIVFALMMIAVPLLMGVCLGYIRKKRKYTPNQGHNEQKIHVDQHPDHNGNNINTKSFRKTESFMENELSSSNSCSSSNTPKPRTHTKQTSTADRLKLKFNFKRKKKSFQMNSIPPFVVSRQVSTATVGSLDLGIPDDIYQILDPESATHQQKIQDTG